MGKTRSSSKSETVSDNKVSKIDEEPVKVFILHKNLLNNAKDLTEIQLVQLRNPGTEKLSYYAINSENNQFYQLIQFNQPNRSFFIDDIVSSNGKIFLTQLMDIKFLFLYYIRKYANNKAVTIDQIEDSESSLTIEILSKFADKNELEKICDVKSFSDNLFVKYNQRKSLAWLSLVTKKITKNVKEKKIYTGGSGAQSANFEKSSFIEENLNEEKILTYAWGLIGTFITEDLHLELAKYMNITIPVPKTVKEESKEKKNGSKRKPLEEVDKETKNKRIKTEIIISSPEMKTEKIKEKVSTTKEKKLAKAASGTKSIMSFFKK